MCNPQDVGALDLRVSTANSGSTDTNYMGAPQLCGCIVANRRGAPQTCGSTANLGSTTANYVGAPQLCIDTTKKFEGGNKIKKSFNINICIEEGDNI